MELSEIHSLKRLAVPPCKTLFSDKLTRGLLVRKEYVSILAAMESRRLIEPDEVTRTLIIGTPGTGKSIFGIYCLLNAISKRENVAFRPLWSQNQPFYFTYSNGVYHFSKIPALNAMYAFVLDGNELNTDFNPSLQASSLTLFASPDTRNYNEFKKVDCEPFFLNPWSKQEIELLVATGIF